MPGDMGDRAMPESVEESIPSEDFEDTEGSALSESIEETVSSEGMGESVSSESGEDTEEFAPPEGRGGHAQRSLSEMLPDLLSNLWVLAVCITVVVYGERLLSLVRKPVAQAA
jgi:hypothetical protein